MDQLGRDVDNASTDYGARLRRRWWVVALGVLIGVGLAHLFTVTRTPQYTSSTTVLVIPSAVSTGASSAAGRTSAVASLDTEAEIMRSAQVADAARAVLRTTEPATSLLGKVEVSVPPNASVLQVRYVDSTPNAAQAGARAFAEAYLTYRTATNKRDVDTAVAGLTAQLKTAQTQLQAASDKAAALPANSPERVYAEAQRNILINQITTLNGRLSTLTSMPVSAGQVLTQATLPVTASFPLPALNLGAGAVAGLLLGLALAMLADQADHRLRRPGDVARRLRLPLLAEVPPTRRKPGVVPGSEHAGVFDRLRNALAAHGGTPRLTQVCDPRERGASGTVALQLARSLAGSAGRATLVVAHRSSLIPGWLGLDDRAGLAEVLRGESSFDAVCYEVPGLPGVSVVPAGRDTGELETLLQSPALRAVLRGAYESAPAIVVESLGTGQSAAAQGLAAASDALVLVAERGVSNDHMIADAAEGATRMGARIAGVVLAPPVTRRTPRGPQVPTAPNVHRGEIVASTSSDTGQRGQRVAAGTATGRSRSSSSSSV